MIYIPIYTYTCSFIYIFRYCSQLTVELYLPAITITRYYYCNCNCRGRSSSSSSSSLLVVVPSSKEKEHRNRNSAWRAKCTGSQSQSTVEAMYM